MTKRPSLSDNMKAMAHEDIQDFSKPIKPNFEKKPQNQDDIMVKKSVQSSRDGMKKILTPIDPEFHKKLKILAIRKELTLEEIVREALSEYASKHGNI